MITISLPILLVFALITFQQWAGVFSFKALAFLWGWGAHAASMLAVLLLQTPEDLGQRLATFTAELLALSAFIFALVAFLKKCGVQGNNLTYSAFGGAFLLGMGYRYSAVPLVTFADWFWAVVFSALAGFVATQTYDGIRSAANPTLKI